LTRVLPQKKSEKMNDLNIYNKIGFKSS